MKKKKRLINKYNFQANYKKLEKENSDLKEALKVANTQKDWAIQKLKKLVNVMLEL